MNGAAARAASLARDFAQRDERGDAGQRATGEHERGARAPPARGAIRSSTHSTTTMPGGWPLLCCG